MKVKNIRVIIISSLLFKLFVILSAFVNHNVFLILGTLYLLWVGYGIVSGKLHHPWWEIFLAIITFIIADGNYFELLVFVLILSDIVQTLFTGIWYLISTSAQKKHERTIKKAEEFIFDKDLDINFLGKEAKKIDNEPIKEQKQQTPINTNEDSKKSGIVIVENEDGKPVTLKIRSEDGFEFNEDGNINLEETAMKHVAAAFDADGTMIPLRLLSSSFPDMKIISAITLEQKNAQDKQAEEQSKAQEEAMRLEQAAQAEQAQAIQAEEAKKQGIAAQVEEAPLGNNEKAFVFKSEDGTYTFGEARTDNGVSSFKTEGKAIDVVNKAKKQSWSKGFDFEVIPIQIGTTGTGQFQQPVYEYSVVAKQKQVEESTEADAQESNTAYWNDKLVKVMGEVKEGERTYIQVQLDNGETKRVSKESLFDSEKQPLYPREQKAEQVKAEKPIDHLKNISKKTLDVEGLANQLRDELNDDAIIVAITDSFNESFDKIKSAKNGIARGQARTENENWRKVGLLFGLNLVNPIE